MKIDGIKKILLFKEYFILSIIIAGAISLYTFINWQKHESFQTFGWDTSVFDQQIYLASRFQSPYSSLHQTNGLADHFHPLLLIVGGILYRIWADPKILYFLQCVIVSLSAIPLYFIAKFHLQKVKITKISVITLSLLLVIMYLFSVAFQAMILDEIHDDVLVSLPILLTLYFVFTKKWKWYWIAFAWVLLTKEEYGLLSVPLAIYIFLKQHNYKIAVLTAVTGIAAFYLLIYQIMPYLAGNRDYSHFFTENKPNYILQRFIQNPEFFITKLFDHQAKLITWKTTLFSYGFLPLLSPINMMLPISSLTIRFYDETTFRRYEYNNHYASPFIPLIAVSSAIGLSMLLIFMIKKLHFSKNLVLVMSVLYLVSSIVIQDLILHGPINSIFKKSFYETYAWEYDARELIKQVPQRVTIASQNSLLPHLSQRENFYLLPAVGDAKYIAVDLHPGPNKFGAYSASQISNFIAELTSKKLFTVVWQKNKAMLLKKL